MISKEHGQGLLWHIRRYFRAAVRIFLGFEWRTVIVYERDLNTPIPDIATKVPIEVVHGDSSYFERLPSMMPVDRREEYKKRLTQNKIWLLALINGQLAYSTWISFEDDFDPNTGIHIPIGPREAYLVSSYAVPEYRGLGLHSYMTAQRLLIAKEKGTEKMIGHVFRDNSAARRVLDGKLGFQETRRILAVRWLKWRWRLPMPFKF